MKQNITFPLLFLIKIAIVSCKTSSKAFRTSRPDVLKDKIAGGWAGKMIGVTYGAPLNSKRRASYSRIQ